MFAEQCNEVVEGFTSNFVICNGTAPVLEVFVISVRDADRYLAVAVKTREYFMGASYTAYEAGPAAKPFLFLAPLVLDLGVLRKEIVGETGELAINA